MYTTMKRGLAWGCLMAAALAAPELAGAHQRGAAATGPSGIYCRHSSGNAVDILAIKVRPDGALDFGVSRWFAGGQNVSLFGRAIRVGDHWRYEEGLASADPDAHCRVDIRTNAGGGATIAADPKARCAHEGGHGTNLGLVRFSQRTYWGPVTIQLRDPDAFQHFTGC
jgi:hypothetical protein